MNKSHPNKKLVVSCSNTIELILLSDIVSIEALQNYSKFHLTDGRLIHSNRNFGYYRMKLSHERFHLCHKSYLVNFDMVVRFHKDGYLEMIDGSRVPVARRRKEEFLNRLILSIEGEQIHNYKIA